MCGWYATGDSDYTPGPFNVTFTAGSTSVAFNVTFIDDNISEGNETFNLTISPRLLPEGITVGDPDEVIVIIVDDDSE